MYIYICITESLCCTAEINTTLQINYNSIKNFLKISWGFSCADWVKNHWAAVNGTSLVAQGLRIHLPMQGTQVWSLVQEDPTCRGATKPVRHNYWSPCTLGPKCHNYWAHVLQLLKPACLACARQQEKPPQWEARAPQGRVAPAGRH